MNKRSYLAVKIFLWIICAYHIVAGIAAVVSQNLAAKIGGLLFGVRVTVTPQIRLLIIYLGAFSITFAVLIAFAALDPVRNRKIIYGGIIYFAIRAIDRIVFWELLQQHTVGPAPNWFRIIVIVIMGGGLLVFMPRAVAENIE